MPSRKWRGLGRALVGASQGLTSGMQTYAALKKQEEDREKTRIGILSSVDDALLKGITGQELVNQYKAFGGDPGTISASILKGADRALEKDLNEAIRTKNPILVNEAERNYQDRTQTTAGGMGIGEDAAAQVAQQGIPGVTYLPDGAQLDTWGMIGQLQGARGEAAERIATVRYEMLREVELPKIRERLNTLQTGMLSIMLGKDAETPDFLGELDGLVGGDPELRTAFAALSAPPAEPSRFDEWTHTGLNRDKLVARAREQGVGGEGANVEELVDRYMLWKQEQARPTDWSIKGFIRGMTRFVMEGVTRGTDAMTGALPFVTIGQDAASFYASVEPPGEYLDKAEIQSLEQLIDGLSLDQSTTEEDLAMAAQARKNNPELRDVEDWHLVNASRASALLALHLVESAGIPEEMRIEIYKEAGLDKAAQAFLDEIIEPWNVKVGEEGTFQYAKTQNLYALHRRFIDPNLDTPDPETPPPAVQPYESPPVTPAGLLFPQGGAHAWQGPFPAKDADPDLPDWLNQLAENAPVEAEFDVGLPTSPPPGWTPNPQTLPTVVSPAGPVVPGPVVPPPTFQLPSPSILTPPIYPIAPTLPVPPGPGSPGPPAPPEPGWFGRIMEAGGRLTDEVRDYFRGWGGPAGATPAGAATASVAFGGIAPVTNADVTSTAAPSTRHTFSNDWYGPTEAFDTAKTIDVTDAANKAQVLGILDAFLENKVSTDIKNEYAQLSDKARYERAQLLVRVLPWAEKAGQLTGINPWIIVGIMQQESRFSTSMITSSAQNWRRQQAAGTADANWPQNIMQIKPGTADGANTYLGKILGENSGYYSQADMETYFRAEGGALSPGQDTITEMNVLLAAAEMKRLVDTWQGLKDKNGQPIDEGMATVVALASYNLGQGKVAAIIKRHESKNGDYMDALVEIKNMPTPNQSGVSPGIYAGNVAGLYVPTF